MVNIISLVSKTRNECAIMQLSVLATENAALMTKLTDREQAAQLEMQDLRKFCITSQERDSDKDSVAYKEVQQQQRQMMIHLSDVESLVNQANASTQHISTRLDKVIQCCNDRQAPAYSCINTCIKAVHICCHLQKRSNSYVHVFMLCMEKDQLCIPQIHPQAGLCCCTHFTCFCWCLCQYKQLC